MRTINIDRARNWVTIRTSGFWLKEQTEAMCQELRTIVPTLGDGVGRHALICDLSGSGVGPAETINSLMRIMGDPGFASIRARHVAFVSASALARLQFMRLAAIRPGIAVCESIAEAEAWIEQQRAELLSVD